MPGKRITQLARKEPQPGDSIAADSTSRGTYRIPLGQENGVPILGSDGSLADQGGYLDRGTIVFGAVNWDVLVNTGAYSVVEGGTGGTNAPPASNQNGTLIVHATDDRVLQIYTSPSGDAFFRTKTGSFGAWQSLLSVPDGYVTTNKLADSAVTSVKLANGAVTTPKIADDVITTPKLADGSVTEHKLANGAVTASKLAPNSVGSSHIVDGAIIASKLAPGSVVTSKIGNASVTNEKLATASVGTANIVDGAVTSAKLAGGAVTTDKIGDSAVTGAKIAPNSITTTHIQDGAVTGAKIADGAVSTAKLADGSVTTAKLASGSVGTGNIQDGAVTTAKIANEAVTNAKLAANAVGTSNIQDNAVTTAKIANSAVTAPKLALNTAPTGTPVVGDWAILSNASGSTYKVPLGQANGIPFLNSLGAFAASNAYLNRGAIDFHGVDWDTIVQTGVYNTRNLGSGGNNKPPASYGWGVLLVFQRIDNEYIVQLYFPHINDPFIYYRVRYESGWSAWRRVGASYGSNANGSYVRLPDGTQICWGTTAGSAQTETWTYPAAFVAAPVVSVGVQKSASDTPVAANFDAAPSATSVSIKKWAWTGSTFGSTTTQPVNLVAIGRWY